jgi:hypothetical protein
LPNRKSTGAAQTVAATRTSPVLMPLDPGQAVPENRPAPYLNPRRFVHLPFVTGQVVSPGSSRFISVLCRLHEMCFFDSNRTKAASMPRN